jgi:hypothetical protein
MSTMTGIGGIGSVVSMRWISATSFFDSESRILAAICHHSAVYRFLDAATPTTA